MKFKNSSTNKDFEADPFHERSPPRFRRSLQLLGAQIHFETDARALLQLVDDAFGNLPRHRFSSNTPELQISILRGKPPHIGDRSAPAPLALFHAGGVLGGSAADSNFVVASPRERTALVVVSPRMMRFPYHVRYELIEFAVFSLAARVQRLVPLHAACVGLGGRGVLLMGNSGAGKSTVALQCLLDGFDFLSEDSVFVAPRGMRATGAANFLHTRAESLHWLGRSAEAAEIRASPVIRRRSGEKKYELDLRKSRFRLAERPLRIVGIVMLSSQSAGKNPLLNPLSGVAFGTMLTTLQAYGASQPQWKTFSQNASRMPAFELRRGKHPKEAAVALRALLAGS
jgi:hypothetical protein